MSGRILAILRRTWTWAVRCVRAAGAAAVRFRDDRAYRRNAGAVASMAVTAALTVLAMDYLVTGGLDWSPGAPRIVPEAQAATIEPEVRFAAPRTAQFDMLAMTPMTTLEQEVSFSLLTEDDLLGGPDDTPAPRLELAAMERVEQVKGENSSLIVAAAPRLAIKHKPPQEL